MRHDRLDASLDKRIWLLLIADIKLAEPECLLPNESVILSRELMQLVGTKTYLKSRSEALTLQVEIDVHRKLNCSSY